VRDRNIENFELIIRGFKRCFFSLGWARLRGPFVEKKIEN
jgi:hypothetical protein